MDDQDDALWKPLVPFEDDPSPSYVHGFEAGMVWQQMLDENAEIDVAVHAENEGTLRNMANASGYEMEISPSVVDGWLQVTFYRRPTHGGLSIVK